MAAPTLDDYEYQFDDDGLLLNSSDAGYVATLPFFDVARVGGLDSPEFRTAQRSHEGVDGGYVDSEFMEMRTIIIEGTLYADPADPDTFCDQLRYNFRPSATDRPFYFKHPNKPERVVYGKGQGARYDITTLRKEGKTEAVCTIICPVPYIYDLDDLMGSGSLGGVDTGHGFNHGFNLSFGGSVGYDGSVPLFNAGTHRAYPVITIYGPITTPSLTESQSGKTLIFDIDLSSTDYLVIDTRRHSITLNGTASRRDRLISGPRSWWWIEPGSATVRLGGSSGFGTGSATAVAGSSTADYVEATNADVADVFVNDKCHLFDSTGALKESTVFTVTSKVDLGTGNTKVNFTPAAAANPVTTDILKAGTATFTVSMKSTYY